MGGPNDRYEERAERKRAAEKRITVTYEDVQGLIDDLVEELDYDLWKELFPLSAQASGTVTKPVALLIETTRRHLKQWGVEMIR